MEQKNWPLGETFLKSHKNRKYQYIMTELKLAILINVTGLNQHNKKERSDWILNEINPALYTKSISETKRWQLKWRENIYQANTNYTN